MILIFGAGDECEQQIGESTISFCLINYCFSHGGAADFGGLLS